MVPGAGIPYHPSMQDPKELWKSKGGDNPYYWILTNNKDWGKNEFYAQGVADIQKYVVPFFEKHGITPERSKQFTTLDIGCGTGRLSRALSALCGNVVGADISPTMIAGARKDNADVPNLSFVETSGKDLHGIDDASIDFVFSFITFQHFLRKSAVESTFRDLHRVLKPGGYGKIQVRGEPGNAPGKAVWFRGGETRYMALVLYRGMIPLLWTRPYHDLLGVCFSDNAIRSLVKAAGFTDVVINRESGKHLWVEFRK